MWEKIIKTLYREITQERVSPAKYIPGQKKGMFPALIGLMTQPLLCGMQ